MIHIVKGLSGFGKTEYLWNIIENIQQPEQKIIVLIPEQFSFESEKKLMQIQQKRKFVHAEVLSFTKLSNLIFRECGGLTSEVLSDNKNNIIINIILHKVRKKLKIYAKQIKHPSFHKSILKVIGSLKNDAIQPKDLLKYSKNIKYKGDLLSSKLLDINIIYSAYQEEISNWIYPNKYIDSHDVINVACDILNKEDNATTFFKNKKVFIDGFNSFTKSEYNMLQKIISNSNEVYVTLCLPDENVNNLPINIFNSIKKTEKILIEIAQSNNLKIQANFLTCSHRFKNKYLEIFNKSVRKLICGENVAISQDWSNQDIVNIIKIDNISKEIEFVASEICRLIREEGYNYRDINVITRNLQLYRLYIQSIFQEYDIPYFLDEKKLIENRSFIIFLKSSLEAIKRNFQTIQILKILKSSILEIDQTMIFKLEIYCSMWNISGDMWLKEFSFNPKGFSEKIDKKDEELIDSFNKIRLKVITYLKDLKNNLKKGSTAKDYIRIIYNYLIKMDIPNHLQRMSKINFKQEKAFVNENENVELWDIVVNIFDDITDILGDNKISPNTFIDIFLNSLNVTKVGAIPQTLDQIIIGAANSMVSHNPKIVFVIGMNQGLFPLATCAPEVFSESECEMLSTLGFSISQGKFERSLDERYFIYSSISAPSDKVYISYCRNSLDRKPISKSSIIVKILNSFKNLKVKEFSDQDLNHIQNNKTAYKYLCRNFNNPLSQGILKYLSTEKDFTGKIKKLNNIINQNVFKIIDVNILENYIGNILHLSPSSIERYHTCKFKFFCNDLLKIKKNKTATLNNTEIGILMHYILKIMVEKHFKDNKDSTNIIAKNINKEVDQLLKAYLDNIIDGQDNKNNEFIYFYTSLGESVKKILEVIYNERLKSKFIVKDLELEVSNTFNLDEEKKVKVSGKIDRVDTYDENGKIYIRVIDYKSGNKDFCLDDIFHGLNMQMLLYLFALINSNNNYYKDGYPSGILYMPMKYRLEYSKRSKNNSNTDIKNFNTKLKMNGILINDMIVLNAMEEDLKGEIIPAKINKDFGLSKHSSIIEKEDMHNISRHVEKIIKNMANDVYSGNIEAYPIYNTRYQDVCSYCEYKSVCKIEYTLAAKMLHNPPDNWLHTLNKK